MRFFQPILKFAVTLILTYGLYCLVGNELAQFLSRTIYSGLFFMPQVDEFWKETNKPRFLDTFSGSIAWDS